MRASTFALVACLASVSSLAFVSGCSLRVGGESQHRRSNFGQRQRSGGPRVLSARQTESPVVDLALLARSRALCPSRRVRVRLDVSTSEGKTLRSRSPGRTRSTDSCTPPTRKSRSPAGATFDGAIYARQLSYAGDLTVRAARVTAQPAACEEPETVFATPTAVPAPAETR